MVIAMNHAPGTALAATGRPMSETRTMIRFLDIAPIAGERRTPVAVARVLVGVVVVTYSLHGRAKGPFGIRPPTGANGLGGAGLVSQALSDRVAALLQEAAEADPAILAHLRMPAPSRTQR